MTNSSLYQAVKHDLLYGLLPCWKFLIPLIFVVAMICLNQVQNVQFYTGSSLSFGDAWFGLMEGMDVFNPADPTERIQYDWIALHLYLGFIVCQYPLRDLKGHYGWQVLLRETRRQDWWLGKCAFALMTSVAYYAIMLLTVGLIICFVGEPSLTLHPNLHQMNVTSINVGYFLVQGVLIPLWISITLSLMVVLLTLVCGPVLAIVLLVLVMMLPVFYDHPLIISRFLMLCRNACFVPGDGMGNWQLLHTISCLLLNGIVICFGNHYFIHMDILGKREG